MEADQKLSDRCRVGRISPACYNLAKGIAMALVIYSHSIGRYAVDLSRSLQIMALPLKYVGFGAVMVFYLVTGMGLPDKLPRLNGKKTAKELLLPYLWVALSYCVLFAPVHWLFGTEWERALTVALQYAAAFALGVPQSGQTVGGFTMTWCTAAWYFLAAFWGIHLATAIGRLEKRWIRAVLLLLCEAAGLWLTWKGVFWFCVAAGLQAAPVIYLGWRLRAWGGLEQMLRIKWIWVPLLLLPLLNMDLVPMPYSVALPLKRITALASALLLLSVSLKLKDLRGNVVEALRSVGMYSYWILLLHAMEMEILPWYRMSRRYFIAPPTRLMLELAIKAVLLRVGCMGIKRLVVTIRRKRRR